jgi:formiminoglutamate deiminase
VTGEPARRWHAERAWLGAAGILSSQAAAGHPAGVACDVLIEASGERFTAVTPGVAAADAPPGTTRLPGLTLPGLANAHSHAFHRALRWMGPSTGESFWSWREGMYRVAARLDPDTYYALARATFAEMALAGITCVGEFHYVHHNPDGTPYANPNEMGLRLIEAAADAGLRITLLDACYLAGGFEPGGAARPLRGAQLRFGDGDAAGWAARMAEFSCDSHGMASPHARIGAAIHSVRAVPPGQMTEIMAWSHHHGAPVHAHLSEQPQENAETRAAFCATPAQVLEDAGVLGPRATMVHATHLTGRDIELLGGSRSAVCACPLTEADLADGAGHAPALAAAGCALSLGTDGHSSIDLFQEARWLELTQRVVTGKRGHFRETDLAIAATASGHACLGWPDAGEIMPGAHADLVTVSWDSPRAADARWGHPLSFFGTGTAADVRHVVASGRDIVRDGRHLLMGDAAGELAAVTRAIAG